MKIVYIPYEVVLVSAEDGGLYATLKECFLWSGRVEFDSEQECIEAINTRGVSNAEYTILKIYRRE